MKSTYWTLLILPPHMFSSMNNIKDLIKNRRFVSLLDRLMRIKRNMSLTLTKNEYYDLFFRFNKLRNIYTTYNIYEIISVGLSFYFGSYKL